MKFNLKLFVLVGVLAGFRDVCGMEKENKDDDGFIVAELAANKEEANALNEAIDEKRVIKAVYRASPSGGPVKIIGSKFKDQLSSILVCDGSNVEKKDIKELHTDISDAPCYDRKQGATPTVYFIFNGYVNTTRSMFNGCSSLKELNLSNFNTSNVTDMAYMFGFCSSLTTLNLSSFDTQNVQSMRKMFNGCTALTKLDLSKFNTKNVTDMSHMFNGCTALRDLNISKFNTQNVTDMSNMFYECTNLIGLDLSKFNTKNVTDMSNMFYECTNLTELNLSKFDTKNVKNMSNMFCKCTTLTILNLRNFDTENVENMSYMFQGCGALTKLDLSNFNTSNVTDMLYMFSGCTALGNICLSKKYAKIMKKDCCCGKGYVYFGKLEVTDLDTDRVNIVWQNETIVDHINHELV